MADNIDLASQPEEIRRMCEELAQLRGWTPEEAWEKAGRAAEILQMSKPEQGLVFALEAARTESRCKAKP